MWVPDKVIDWFRISVDTVDTLREELAGVRAEREALSSQLATTQANFNWLCTRVNSLEIERAALLEKAYGVKVTVPEIVRQPTFPRDFNTALFEDLGDDNAKQLGLPVYSA